MRHHLLARFEKKSLKRINDHEYDSYNVFQKVFFCQDRLPPKTAYRKRFPDHKKHELVFQFFYVGFEMSLPKAEMLVYTNLFSIPANTLKILSDEASAHIDSQSEVTPSFITT